MKRQLFFYLIATLLIITAPQLMQGAVNTQHLEQYSEKSPLVVLTDWEFPPYEYRDDNGDAKGYNIDVMKMILENMHIPYTFEMHDWASAVKLFGERKGDIIILKNKIFTDDVYYSEAILATYHEAIAKRKGEAMPNNFAHFDEEMKVGVKRGDYVEILALDEGLSTHNIIHRSPKEGLTDLINGDLKFYLYGEASLTWWVNELHLDNIEVVKTPLPATTFRFASHSKELINSIDDQFARLEQAGKIKKINNKWFHPEIAENDASPIAIYLILGTLTFIFVAIVINRIIANRISKRTKTMAERNKVMTTALNISNHDVIGYDIKRQLLYNIHGYFLPEEGMPYQEYTSRIHPDDSNNFLLLNIKLSTNHAMTKENVYRWNAGTTEKADWRLLSVRSIAERDNKGRTIGTISTIRDITMEKKKEEADLIITQRFSSIFEQSIIGMSMYDPDGRLLMVNQRMRTIFHFENPKDEFYFNINLFDLPFLKDDINSNDPHDFHFCTQMHIPEREMYDYLEVMKRPIFADNGKLQFYLLSARNISEDRNIYQQSRENDLKLRTINEAMSHYENDLKYLLKENKMRVWRSSLKEGIVSYFSDLNHKEVEYTFNEFMQKVQTEVNETIYNQIIHPNESAENVHKAVIPIKNLFEQDNKTHWYGISSMTEYDEDGQMKGYFGVIRDLTSFIDIQIQLKEETQRAMESGRQKSAFLANMTHEIRTPLNSIVGFCDLLQTMESTEEKKEFIRIIRHNCDMLLQLINDILVISTIDSNGKIVNPRRVDFANDFEDICLTLSQRVDNPNVTFIKLNPYSELVTEVDSGRLQQVVTNFVTNAIKYTQQGHIKVGYRLENGGMTIYCEDTGSGIPKDKCDKIFERFVKLNDFVQGTGLGLSICKTISEQCNGKIGVNSEVGKGSIFWIWIPCVIEKASKR